LNWERESTRPTEKQKHRKVDYLEEVAESAVRLPPAAGKQKANPTTAGEVQELSAL
jgi:hypothetical protein